MKIVIATKNEGKMREFKSIFSGTDYEVVSMSEMGVDIDVVEDCDTFEGNALKKAHEIMKACGAITVADDSGLCVDALGGAPGVYSARYSGKGATDLKNNLKLLDVMKEETNRKAKFVCAIAIVFPNGESKIFEGEFHGEIAHDMSGTRGFGYDVLFYLPEYNMTSAQISSQLKNEISHRGKALFALKEFLSQRM